MITSFYAALLGLLIVCLALWVIKIRRAKLVKLGDDNNPELQGAIRAHGNATEYIPIALILLALLELEGGHKALIHLGGIAMVVGRLLHAKGLLTDKLPYRVRGMQITLSTIMILAFANIGYAVYSWL